MEFEIGAFTSDLMELFLNSPLFPVMPNGKYIDKNGYEQEDSAKHPFRSPLTLKEATDNCMKETYSRDEISTSFDIGSEKMELTHPYYHIINQAPNIKKRYKATKKTRGSQYGVGADKVDYEKVSFNGKTFTKEYSRNVRGKRNNLSNTSYWSGGVTSGGKFINREANQYKNVHYQYISKILDSGILETLANKYNMTLKRKIDTGLGEEYFSQFNEAPINMLDILGSFGD